MAIFLALNPGKKGALRVAQASLEAQSISKLNAPSLLAGVVLSTIFGFISSFFGIGGGFLYVMSPSQYGPGSARGNVLNGAQRLNDLNDLNLTVAARGASPP